MKAAAKRTTGGRDPASEIGSILPWNGEADQFDRRGAGLASRGGPAHLATLHHR